MNTEKTILPIYPHVIQYNKKDRKYGKIKNDDEMNFVRAHENMEVFGNISLKKSKYHDIKILVLCEELIYKSGGLCVRGLQLVAFYFIFLYIFLISFLVVFMISLLVIFLMISSLCFYRFLSFYFVCLFGIIFVYEFLF